MEWDVPVRQPRLNRNKEMPPKLWKVKVWYYDIKTKDIKIVVFKDLPSADSCITKAGNELGMDKISKLLMEWYWKD